VKRVLVADDQPAIPEAIRDALEDEYWIDIATTAYDVVDMVLSEHYDALIIDVDFGPGETGLEVAERIRQYNSELRILIISAVAYSDAVRQKVVDLGAKFCEKPVPMDTIRRFLEAGAA